nr:MAG TPA: hypothetical protein [Myoviridae sp. ctTS62]
MIIKNFLNQHNVLYDVLKLKSTIIFKIFEFLLPYATCEILSVDDTVHPNLVVWVAQL